MNAMQRSGRQGFTMLEIMLASAVSSVIFVVTLAFMSTSQKQVVKTSEHADARIEAMKIMEVLEWDLDRLVVGDEIDDPNANVLDPFKKSFNTSTTEFGFYAFHHFEFDQTDKRMVLMPGWIDYRVQKRQDGWGVDLLRNGKPINRAPIADVKIAEMDQAEADKLGISPRHCLTVKIYPLGMQDWLGNKDISSEVNAIKRVFHIKNVESRYACLMSVKRAIRSNPANAPQDPRFQKVLTALPEPPPRADSYASGEVVLAWMQPQMVVKSLFVAPPFDDRTADQNKLAPADTGPQTLAPQADPTVPRTHRHKKDPVDRGTSCTSCHNS